ncbi:hypothetical protein HMPREF9445_02281 [Bacteroides clarus YIT 12056]|uniref:Uncharacterized protein n=1 Tax=Bacteroides clarus YIT 12056 TaxID=762984 RepID=A0ABN0CLB8_9BACE|nr:hypothetical protein HMPREF9445_02281 [Bacteroides clarus YIT 12056]
MRRFFKDLNKILKSSLFYIPIFVSGYYGLLFFSLWLQIVGVVMNI